VIALVNFDDRRCFEAYKSLSGVATVDPFFPINALMRKFPATELRGTILPYLKEESRQKNMTEDGPTEQFPSKVTL
jgi:hypothetical protein